MLLVSFSLYIINCSMELQIGAISAILTIEITNSLVVEPIEFEAVIDKAY